MNGRIICLSENPGIRSRMAEWFHQKWDVPLAAYLGSMDECLRCKNAVPQWYVMLSDDRIIAGMGVIENDFHERKDLAPNICAVYTEDDMRGRGIAGELLKHVCTDMKEKGVDTLYLVTDHIGFYERYGWEFVCMTGCDGGETSRVYVHRM